MIRHIVVMVRKNRRRFLAMFEQITLPEIKPMTSLELAKSYRAECRPRRQHVMVSTQHRLMLARDGDVEVAEKQ